MTHVTPVNTTSLLFRAADERFHSQRGWLDSWHSFSFAGHHHPDWMGFGPLRVINDDTIAAGEGFGMHPHRDMEIITVMVDGELTHADSMGHSAVLRAGEVQRMSAGTGIVHSEINRSNAPCRLLQIWIEPDQGGLAPAYEQKPIAIGSDWTALIHPDAPASSMAIASNTRLWRARPQDGQRLAIPTEPAALIWIQVIAGELELHRADASPQLLQQGDGLGITGTAPAPCNLLGLTPGADVLLFAMTTTAED